MKVNDLVSMWEKTAQGELTAELFRIHLPLEDAARIAALASMFPRRSPEEIVTDLLSAALHEMESSLPYVRGNKVVALDEQGDPLYEDIGLTPRYLELKRKHLANYQTAETHSSY
ncbi:MAG TPA: type 1 pili tip component [Spongiibacteraceae bacterium]